MSVLIEFTKTTEKRAKGERVRVDEQSARSFVERKKVAKRITEKDLETDAETTGEDETAENDTTVTDTTDPDAGGAS